MSIVRSTAVPKEIKRVLIPPTVLTALGAHHGSQRSHRGWTLAEANHERILKTLRDTHGVVGGRRSAAALLRVKRTTLIDKMAQIGISRQPW
jgi:DNA-binding NtrC family response regulator